MSGGEVVERPTFDPDRCQWCGETGFDLEGLAQHVWQSCEVVEQLAEANIENVRAWHRRNWKAAQTRKTAMLAADEGEKL